MKNCKFHLPCRMVMTVLTFLYYMLVSGLSWAQQESIQKTVRATNIQEMFMNRPNFMGGNSVYGIPEAPKMLEGNYYLDPNWNRGSILLYNEDEILNDYFIRYQIEEDQLEVMANEEGSIVKINGVSVKNFISVDSVTKSQRIFMNQRDFVSDSEEVMGFYEVLVDGDMMLVKTTKATFRNSNYNTALMMGEKNDRIVKRDSYYYIVGDSAHAISSKMNQFLELFGDKRPEIRRYINKYNVDIKSELGLVRVFNFYNNRRED
ncbi:hypothetical protein ACFSKL_13605 [Belliella marina]|uniref:Uncharacterized protein n=1 Tax=Belliella marina TaxID=1644146 RepID=A0ABW4VRC0_9BACT